ncbi:gamma-glutamylcyclotransferase family protein [Achromobacter deleyi]|uniref:gamma-glutamylcyclotransferase family protein n=1 Tax=Achromobacter deleyi TaxID=1353891 RepID=UPI001491F836|nr:gamma-glutamylcyclotransferase family protein [Achromobacter deleyi]QVQ27429.1 gamma-glutamylcyclotransferase [Achromobacter deleyi]UIP23025.1 gamma-glutamylcyclotransferase [Achromobacter deleyi]
MSIYVFVYGTLRAGEINDLARAAAGRGLPAASHVGPASVPGMLVDFGDWPGLIPVADGRRVRGDVFRVEPALIALMDEIEEYRPGQPCLFVRREVQARMEPPGQAALLSCQYYPIDPAQRAEAIDIAGDDWIAYRLARIMSGGR